MEAPCVPMALQTEKCQVRKVAERKFPEIFEFLSRILPRISLRIFPEFIEEFSCLVSWETETRKNSPKIPAIFQCKKFPGKHGKNIHKILLGSRQSKVKKNGCMWMHFVADRNTDEYCFGIHFSLQMRAQLFFAV